jgi:hypothetical protein
LRAGKLGTLGSVTTGVQRAGKLMFAASRVKFAVPGPSS